MAWGRLVPIFHGLFLVWFHSAWASVEPPTNVTLHCHNLHNVLKWNYNQFVPGLRFKVYIGSSNRYSEDRWVDPPSQHFDVSFLSDPKDDYFLQISAEVGGNTSTVVPPDGLTFSYFKDSLVAKICDVDLPSVNITTQPDANVMLRFMHPWLLYHKKIKGSSNLKHRKRSEDYEPKGEEPLPEFNYIVTLYQRPHDFICEESVCEGTLPVDLTERSHCLTIVGELEKMRVRGTQSYCAQPYETTHNPNYYYIYILILLATGVVLAFVTFMVCWKKTRPSSRFPNLVNRTNHPAILIVQPLDITVPQVEPASPTPLLMEEEENSTTVTPQTVSDRLPIGTTEDEVMEGEQENDEEGGYRGGMDLDVDETENFNDVSSGYESRPNPRA